jgi:hypothetical protein
MTSVTPPDLVETGFHPLDGARYLRRLGIDGQVAYHSCAMVEAETRGLRDALAAEFKPGEPLLTDVLLYCDITTGPGGNYIRPADRLAEICARYGPDHEVTRFVKAAAPKILTTAGQVDELLPALPR